MRLDLIASSLVLALVVLPLLAWKWRIKMGMAVVAAVVVGPLTSLIVSQVDLASGGLKLPVLLPIEFVFILMIPFLVVIIRFYRDPERHPRETKNVILAPADGQVIYVNRVEKGSSLVSTKGGRKFRLDEIAATNLLAGANYLVGIDMNLLNVHVNRSPIAGKALLRKRTSGKFISLRKPESEVVNERLTTIISNGRFSVGVIQIASRLVRTIVTYVKEGDSLQIGQRIGAIVFGSQVDVAIPELDSLKIEVKVGDEVKAGVSVIARYG
ncbi:MAG: phosphatidylserine decarboxylase family protein [Chloroflexi bacterium]|nr:phosphatidylserine decarboxylase family protein [Chloroflexota bacterium]